MEDAKSSANRCLVVVERIICKAKPRIEVPKDGLFLKTLGTWTKPVPLTKSVMALSGCLTVTGFETKLYRKPRFRLASAALATRPVHNRRRRFRGSRDRHLPVRARAQEI